MLSIFQSIVIRCEFHSSFHITLNYLSRILSSNAPYVTYFEWIQNLLLSKGGGQLSPFHSNTSYQCPFSLGRFEECGLSSPGRIPDTPPPRGKCERFCPIVCLELDRFLVVYSLSPHRVSYLGEVSIFATYSGGHI